MVSRSVGRLDALVGAVGRCDGRCGRYNDLETQLGECIKYFESNRIIQIPFVMDKNCIGKYDGVETLDHELTMLARGKSLGPGLAGPWGLRRAAPRIYFLAPRNTPPDSNQGSWSAVVLWVTLTLPTPVNPPKPPPTRLTLPPPQLANPAAPLMLA